MGDIQGKDVAMLSSMGELFAERMKHAMQKAGKKQIDIANATGIDKGAISNYLRGKYVPKTDAMAKIAHALNVSVDWLRGYEEFNTTGHTLEIQATVEEQLLKVKADICEIIVRLHADETFYAATKWLNSLSTEEVNVFLSFAKMLENKQMD